GTFSAISGAISYIKPVAGTGWPDRKEVQVKEFLTAEISYEKVLREARESVSAGLDEVHRLMLEVAEHAPGDLSEHLGALLARRGKRIRSTFLFLLASSGRAQFERTARVS